MPALPVQPSTSAVLQMMFGRRAPGAWLACFADYMAPAWGGGRADVFSPFVGRGMNSYVSIGYIRDGAVSRSVSNVDFVAGLLVEDIGTKADADKTRGLLGLPTMIVETSPGNFQWFYRWEVGITDLRVHAALMAAVDTDPGCRDATRYARLPGGTNTKPGRPPFDTVAHLFEPTRTFRVEDVAAALGVDISPAGLASVKVASSSGLGVWSADLNAPDEGLMVLGALGLVKGAGNEPGKVEITCPFVHEHSGGLDNGTAYLGDNRIECHHGHCVGRRVDNYRVRLGEMLVERGLVKSADGVASFRAGLAFSCVGVPPLPPANDVAEIARRHVAACESAEVEKRAAGLDGLLARYVWLRDCEAWADRENPAGLPQSPVNMAQIAARVGVGKPGVAGVRSATNIMLGEPGLVVCAARTYRPGGARIIGGLFNTWVDEMPAGVRLALDVKDADVAPWLDLVEHVFDDADDKAGFLDWCSFVLQNRGAKINWCPLLIGPQGVGKDAMLAPVMRFLGPRNTRVVNSSTVLGRFTSWLQTEVVLLAELSASERFDFYNHVKTYIAAPPDTVTVEEKGARPFEIPNTQCWFAYSNNAGALPVDHDDRRFAVWVSSAAPKDADYYQSYFDWLGAGGGCGLVVSWLMQRAIGAGFSANRCPATAGAVAAKREMAVSALGAAARWAAEWAEGRTLVSVPEILTAARGADVPARVRNNISEQEVLRAFRALGAVRVGDRMRIAGLERVRLWALQRAPMLSAMNDDDLRAAYAGEKGRHDAAAASAAF